MPLLNNRDITSILRGCLKSDRKSQEELYRQLYDFAMKICCRYTSNREECVELVNESFFRLFKNLQQFDATKGTYTLLSVKECFKPMLINTCVDHYHKINLNGSGRGGKSIGGRSGAGLIEAIRSLSPTYRMVFNLSVFERYGHGEISQMLGISVNTSQSCLLRAKDHLKTLL